MSRTPALLRVSSLLLLSLSIALPSANTEASQWSAWTGDVEPASIDDFQPDIRTPPWFQTWDAWLWTDDNKVIVVQLLGSSVARRMQRNGSARAAIIDLSLVGGAAEREAIHVDRGFDWGKGDWGWNDPALDLYFLDCHVRADGDRWQLAMIKGDVRIEVELEAESELWMPGSGRLSGGDAQGRLVLLPRANFRGTLQTDADAGPSPISGVATLHSTWMDGFPGDVVQQWTRFIAHRADGLSIIAGEVTAPEDSGASGAPWVLVLLNGEVIFSSTDVLFQASGMRADRRGMGTYNLAENLRFAARAGDDTVNITVRNSRQVSVDDLLTKLSPILRAIVARLMAPMDYELEATYEATLRIGGTTAAIAGAGWTTLNFAR